MEAFFKIKRKEAAVDSSDGKADTTDDESPEVPEFIPWVEKYRPAKIDEVAQQDEVLASLRPCLTGSDTPHLLFYGPPGTGKTTTILAFCKELYGMELYRDRVLELNASDERGINVIRTKVKDFAGLAVSSTMRANGTASPPFKFVILDEADSMTSAAQSALRRTMEVHSKSTRFCLICNYVSRIIDPITSRCSKYRFKPLAEAQMRDRLNMIAKAERVNITDGAIDALITFSDGDMRKSVTFLQCVSKLKLNESVTTEDVLAVSGFIPQQVIDDWLHACFNGSYDNINSLVNDMIMDGFPASQLIGQLHDTLIDNEALTDPAKSAILEKIAIAEKRLMDGSSEFLQLMDISCEIMKQSYDKD